MAIESKVGGDEGANSRLVMVLAASAGECGGECGESGAGTVEPGTSTPVDVDVDEIEPAAAMLTHTRARERGMVDDSRYRCGPQDNNVDEMRIKCSRPRQTMEAREGEVGGQGWVRARRVAWTTTNVGQVGRARGD